jgi:hypothetical protein
VSAEEIEEIAESLIGDEDELVAKSFGPISGNIVSNNPLFLVAVKQIEEKIEKWQDTKRRAIERAEENVAAFNDVGQLPTKPCGEIAAECQSLGFSRVIIAEFGVDESDTMTDYWGGRTSRRVVIGYGKGKRESFKQLREAAASFKPTECFGPGKGEFTASVVYSADGQNGNGYHVYKGQKSPWHNDIGNGSEFDSREAAEAFVKSAGKPTSIVDGETEHHFEWSISERSVEHRENYSMGGGNYLGFSRYGGWKVSSTPAEYFTGDNLHEIADFDKSPVKKAKATKKASAAAEVVEHEVSDSGTHVLSVKVGKRTIGVSVSKSLGVSVYTGKSRYGKHYRNFDRAIASYKTANIKKAIEAAREATETRLNDECGKDAAEESNAVTIDPASFGEFAWL